VTSAPRWSVLDFGWSDFRKTGQYPIIGCPEGDADPHHIVPRSHAGSSDDERNLLNLHRGHHEEWHQIGREAFLAKYTRRLKPSDIFKIRLAAELETEAKLLAGPAVDAEEA
jgi:hypothetical protein